MGRSDGLRRGAHDLRRNGGTLPRVWRFAVALALAVVLIVQFPPAASPTTHSAPETAARELVVFRTDATAAELASVGADILVPYGTFSIARGPADAVPRLEALGRYAVPSAATTLHLLSGDIDVRKLEASAQAAYTPDVYGEAPAIVHFLGPIASAWQADLTGRGVSVLRPIPANGLLVRGSPSDLESLRGLPYVDAVLPYEPGWKLPPGIPTDGRLLDVRIVVLPGESPEAIEAWLAHRGVAPRRTTEDSAGLVGAFGSGDFRWVRATIDSRLIPLLADLPEVEFVDPVVPVHPVNAEADWVIQTNRQLLNGSGDYRYWWIGLDGRGQVIGIADSGLDFDEAYFRQSVSTIAAGDLYNVTDPGRRKVVRYVDMGVATGQLTWPGGGGLWDPYSDADCAYNGGANGHGTAVASAVAGNDNGIGASPNDGNALQAKIYMQDVGGLAQGSTCTSGSGEELIYLPEDYQDLFGLPGLVYNDPLAPVRIHSNSWSADENAYDLQARQIDAFLWSHPDLTVLFAVGNAGPAAGSIGTPATAKNVVSVGGACNADATLACGPNDLASFGGRGPTSDGRYAPTILTVADGDSATSDGNPWSGATGTPDHGWAGTSYSTPEAAAAAAIIRQYFTDGWYPTAAPVPANGFSPSAALVRGMLIASGVQITGLGTAATTWPNYDQGFGRVLLSNILPLAAAGDTFRTQVVDGTAGLLTGQAETYTFHVAAGASTARFVLTWTDYPGTLGAAKALVNDLDLQVTAPNGTIYRGNRFGSFSLGESIPGGAFDTTNVEEAVLLKAPIAGDYKVQVIASNVPVGPQPFALVATGGLDPDYGRVIMDRPTYSEDDTIRVSVEDGDATAVQVLVASTLEPSGETVILTQSVPGATWRGSIRTAFGQPAPNGLLEVRAGETITAAYEDPSPTHTSVATATVEATPPAIADVVADDIGTTSARIRWTTDLPASAEVRYGTSPGSLTASASSPDLVTSHTIFLSGLQADTLYYYDVTSSDQVGHATVDSNAGRHYAFRTSNWGDVLVIIGDGTFPAERETSFANALNATGWTWGFWRVADLGLPSLSMLQRARAVVWQVGLEQYPAFDAPARSLLGSYLNGGGRLLVASHDAAWSLGSPDSPWYTSGTAAWIAGVLKAAFDCDPSTTSQIVGISGDPISGPYAGSGAIAYTPHRTGGADDEILGLSAGGTSTVLWRDSTTVQGCSPTNQPAGLRWVSSSNNGTAGIGAWGGSPSRLAYFAFEITGLDTNGSDLRLTSATRAQVLDNAIRWLIGTSTTSLDRDHPSVAVTAPDGGTFPGPNVTIAWDASATGPGVALSNFSLDFSPDGGQTWAPLANATGSERTYNWSIGTMPNGEAYLVRLIARDDGTPSLEGIATANRTFAIRRTGGDTSGPLIRPGSLRVAPDPPGSAAPATVNATADDRATGASLVSGAEVFFSSAPPSGANGTGFPMVPGDGSFSASVEAVTWSGALPLPPGTTCAWVHARDASGNWGPYSETCFPAISVGPDATAPVPASLASLQATNGTTDLLLTWVAAWDDGLFGGTTRYRVERAPSPQGPFVPIGADLPATGNASYTFVDPGRGPADPSDGFYRVVTFDAANNSAPTPAIAVKFHVTVTAGLNLVGIPADPGPVSLTSMAGSLGWTEAWAYDNCGGGFAWSAAPPGNDAVLALRSGRALWFNATGAGSLVVLGITPARTLIDLCPGWNLVALPGFAPDVTVALVKAQTGAALVAGFDPADPYRTRILADSEFLVPGRGYWVFVDAAVTWSVEGW